MREEGLSGFSAVGAAARHTVGTLDPVPHQVQQHTGRTPSAGVRGHLKGDSQTSVQQNHLEGC